MVAWAGVRPVWVCVSACGVLVAGVRGEGGRRARAGDMEMWRGTTQAGMFEQA